MFNKYSKSLFTLTIYFLFLIPAFTRADTIVSGAISADTIWSPAGGVYLIDSNFSVDPNVTLTIEPGTVIKGKVTGRNLPSIYGTIIAHGTAEAPIHFSSVSIEESGHWQGLYFKNGSMGDFDYVNISGAGYGGSGYGNFVGIENDGGSLNIKNSKIYDNYITLFDWVSGYYKLGTGIHNISGTLLISSTTINSHNQGILIESGTTTISNSFIQNSFREGLSADGEEPITLLNNVFSGNKTTATISASRDFYHKGNKSTDLTKKGFRISGYVKDGSIFHSEDLPLIIEGQLTIESDKTLTIAPGTLIKMGSHPSFGSIKVAGQLKSEGVEENEVYITSILDDSVGGDTNGDSDLSTPAAKNWNAIYLENNSKVSLDHTVVRYGGYNYNGEYLPGVAATIYDHGSNFLISNSILSNNYGTAIFKDTGILDISESEISNNLLGIWSRGGNISISNSSIKDNNIGIYNQSHHQIDARNNWWGSVDGPKDISTSTLTGTGDSIDGDVLYQPFLTSDPLITPKIFDPVIIIPGIMGSAYKDEVLVIDPILHTYDDLLATLEQNGYIKEIDLFTLPYEWRDSNVLTAAFLRNKINEVQEICQCEKVDLVAHSMGGLVARQYIQSNNYGNDVDQLIFLGTPHKGSPKAYLQWEGGEFPSGFTESLTKYFFNEEAKLDGFKSIFDYIHNRPVSSIKELLPTFDYIKDNDTGILRTYPNNYPTNTFLENINANISSLLNSGVKITNIVGSAGSTTIETIRVVPSINSELWEHGEPDNFYTKNTDQGLEYGDGDETLTIFGATLDNSITNKELQSTHIRIPTIGENEVFKILTGKNSITNIDSGFQISPIILLLQLQSPIDFVVIAPDGKKIGKNFDNNTEYNEILGAFYSGFQTDKEYITILNPLDGEYKIELQGTGSGGEYGVLTSYISDIFATTTQTKGITKPNQVTTLGVAVDNQNPENLETEKEITLEVLVNDINGAYDLGWIKNKKIKDNLVKKVEKIIQMEKKIEIIVEKLPDGKKKEKKIEKLEMKIDKKLAQALLVEIKGYNKDKLNDDAHNLLKKDLEYLINKN